MSSKTSIFDYYLNRGKTNPGESKTKLFDVKEMDKYFDAQYDDDPRFFAWQLIEEENLLFNKDKEVGYFDSSSLDCYDEMKGVYVQAIKDLIIDKFSDLYITVRRKYVILKKSKPKKYETVTWDKYDKSKCSPGARPLFDFMIEAHLKGKYTVCVFAKSLFAKFICFDVDIKDKSNKKRKSQKVVRLLVDTLVEYGIPKERIYISWSGTKGYHVEIFFNRQYSGSKAKEFFDLIVNRPCFKDIFGANIEFLPTQNRAIKLPLGLNFNSRLKKNRFCNFVDIHSGEEFLDIYSIKYFLDIQTIDPKYIDAALEKLKADNVCRDYNSACRNNLTGTTLNSTKNKNEVKQNYEVSSAYSESNLKSSDNKMSIKNILKLERDGLKKPGTRHDSLLKLSILYKCYYKYTQEENKNKLIEWLKRQDKSTYTTSFEDAIKDIEKIVYYTYKRDYKLGKSCSIINISDEEMEEVIKVKQKNAKLLLFALLVHNKKYSDVNEIFYMSYEQMSKATGLSEKTCIDQVKNLEKQEFVEVVERKIPDTNFVYKPNKYRLLLDESIIERALDNKKISFEYRSKDEIRKHFIEGINLIEDKSLRKYLSKKDLHLVKKGKFFKL